MYVSFRVAKLKGTSYLHIVRVSRISSASSSSLERWYTASGVSEFFFSFHWRWMSYQIQLFTVPWFRNFSIFISPPGTEELTFPWDSKLKLSSELQRERRIYMLLEWPTRGALEAALFSLTFPRAEARTTSGVWDVVSLPGHEARYHFRAMVHFPGLKPRNWF